MKLKTRAACMFIGLTAVIFTFILALEHHAELSLHRDISMKGNISGREQSESGHVGNFRQSVQEQSEIIKEKFKHKYLSIPNIFAQKNIQEPLKYHHPISPGIVAQERFRFSKEELKEYGVTSVRILDKMPPAQDLMKEMVFVTAANGGYFMAVREAITLAQKYYPHNKIIFYDLGVPKHQLSKWKNTPGHGIDDLCNVEYRKFNFSRYPRHVKKLKNYAWKFLIVKEVLATSDIIYWMDSSFKFLNSQLGKVLDRNFTSPIMTATFTGHTNFVVTHSQTYTYLPTNITRQRHVQQYEANNMFIANTKEAYEDVLRWMYLCSLTPDCISPNGASAGCHGFGRDGQTHGKCHRFDQAALNILLSNRYNYNISLYTLGQQFHDYKPYKIVRGLMMSAKVQFYYTCDKGEPIQHKYIYPSAQKRTGH